MKHLFLALVLSFVSFSVAHAQESTTDYTASNAVIRQAPSSVGSAYVELKNTTAKSDKLIGANADWVNKIELHEIKTTDNGIMQMSPVDFMPLPAKGTLTLKQGGLHLMLFGIKEKLKDDEQKNITLKFQSGKFISAPFTVQPIGNVQKMMHDKMIMDHDHHM